MANIVKDLYSRMHSMPHLFFGANEQTKLKIQTGNAAVSTRATTKVRDGKTVLRVMSYNIKNADLGKKIPEIAADIRAEQPEIVCVQEVDSGVRRSKKKNILKELSEILQMQYCFFPAIPLQGGTYGIGILSRFPLENCTSTPLLIRDVDEGRVLGSCEVTVNGKTLTVLLTHLSYEDKQTRLAQFDYLQSVFANSAPAVLCGDFNVESFEEFSRINATAVNTAETPFETFIGGGTPFTAIDNIYCSADITLVSKKVCETSVSDHKPLLCELEF